MELTLQQSGAGETTTLTVSARVFAAEFNEPLVHQVLTAYRAGARAGTRAQRSRSEARGGGRKPRRQKGTGLARAGTIRSPIWRGGGVTFAAKPQCHAKKVNKKMYRAAMRAILSELVRQQRMICVTEFDVAEAKTRMVKEKLDGLGLQEALIITPEPGRNLSLGVRNIPRVRALAAAEINPYALIGYDKVLITRAAVEKIEAWLA